jgi:hypothetical protein
LLNGKKLIFEVTNINDGIIWKLKVKLV